MNLKETSKVIIVVLSSCLMQCTCSSNALSLLIIADQAENDSLIEAVERTVDIINNNNNILPEYRLQYTTAGEQVNNLLCVLCCQLY